ncbi:hypothetical protein LIER_36333 [Lithospermum erythrorhizon]|uniref:Zinc-ribbon 15 domain-containing protein n=1 Tax=Lithospermum erythrorhizon TaxID=34254 RepID=A0AAV3P4F6_LITER
MFFFFIGSVEQQVRQVLKKGSGRCISCGSLADLVEYDKALKLFFVPVWKWAGKEPLMHCNNCDIFFPKSLSPPPPPPCFFRRCNFCSRDVQAEYKFCPFCGSAL